MTHDHARRFAQFIHDHDKRFTASVTDDAQGAAVTLRRADDGTEAATVADPAQYQAQFIGGDDPGPTVRAAWDKWGEG